MTFHMKLRGKKLCNGAQARAILEQELGAALRRAGFILQGFLMRGSPVRSGTLRRSWNVGEAQWHGDVFMVSVGTLLVYARAVDAKGKSAGYIGKSVEAARGQVLAAVRQGVHSAAREMYVDF